MDNSFISVQVSTNLPVDHMGISLSTIRVDYKLGIIVDNSLKPKQLKGILNTILWITPTENFYISQVT